MSASPGPPIRFERPRLEHADSWRALVREFRAAGEPLVPFPLEFPDDDFAALVSRLEAGARGEGLPAHFVPNSTYCLVAGGEVVAVSNLRHRLTDALREEGGHIGYGVRPTARRRGHARAILRATLAEAAALGIERALLTCAKRNVASARTILSCGGRLASEAFVERRGEVVQRYEIDTR